MSKSKAPPKLTIVGHLLGMLQRGDLPRGVVQFGSTDRHGAHANFKSFQWLRQRAKGRLTAETIKAWTRQVMDAEGISLARVLVMDFWEFRQRLSASPLRYGPDPNKPILHWNSTPYPLTRFNWLLLSAVWNKHNASFADIGEAVWGDDATPAGRIRQLILRVNRQLAGHKIDLVFSGEGECVSPVADWPT